MENERSRLVAHLDQTEAMLAGLASPADPKLFATIVDLQQTVLRLRAQLAALENPSRSGKSDE